MKIDSDFEMAPVPVTTGPFLHGGDFRVKPFHYRIGGAMREVSQDIRQMRGHHLSFLDHRFQPTVRGSEVPTGPIEYMREI